MLLIVSNVTPNRELDIGYPRAWQELRLKSAHMCGELAATEIL